MAILIFEKSEEITKRLIEMLKDSGHKGAIYNSNSPTDAPRLLQHYKAKAILLDLQFVNNLSMELLRNSKMKDKGTAIIILYTHYSEYNLQQCKGLGADFFLSKYDDFEKIPGIINKIIKQNNTGAAIQ